MLLGEQHVCKLAVEMVNETEGVIHTPGGRDIPCHTGEGGDDD